jgi:hypothetical protein
MPVPFAPRVIASVQTVLRGTALPSPARPEPDRPGAETSEADISLPSNSYPQLRRYPLYTAHSILDSK